LQTIESPLISCDYLAQLLANKEAETKRLRAAWNKNRDESIKAVEQR